MASTSEDINRITYAFNKFFSGFVRDVKDLDDDLRKSVKSHYKIIDKSSDEYLNEFWEVVGSKLLDRDFDLLAEDNLNIELIKGVTVSSLVNAVGDSVGIFNTVYTLAIFAYLKKQVSDSEEAEKLFDQAVKILNVFNNSSVETFEEELEDIIDDDMRNLFGRIKPTIESVAGADASGDASGMMDDVLNKFGDGKIASLAKEIAQNINVEDLKLESPADVMKMLDFSQGGNSALGNIVQQVTSTISNKVSSGELKQEDLVKEAMSMMGSLGGLGGAGGAGGMGGMAGMFNNPFFANMMKNMAGGAMGAGGSGSRVGVRKDVISKMAARDRLRRKLEQKRGVSVTEKTDVSAPEAGDE